MGTDTIFQSYTPFHIYGFNKIDNYDWDGKLVTESFKGDDKSWLICFKGEPTINGVTMKTMDYAKLCDKDYKVVLNDAISNDPTCVQKKIQELQRVLAYATSAK